jgi:hypothetical protein
MDCKQEFPDLTDQELQHLAHRVRAVEPWTPDATWLATTKARLLDAFGTCMAHDSYPSTAIHRQPEPKHRSHA